MELIIEIIMSFVICILRVVLLFVGGKEGY